MHFLLPDCEPCFERLVVAESGPRKNVVEKLKSGVKPQLWCIRVETIVRDSPSSVGLPFIEG